MNGRARKRGGSTVSRGLPLLLAAVGCSLITPLDYVGDGSAGSGQAGSVSPPSGAAGWTVGGASGNGATGGAAGKGGAAAGSAGVGKAGADGGAGEGGAPDPSGGSENGGEGGEANSGGGGGDETGGVSGTGGAGSGGAGSGGAGSGGAGTGGAGTGGAGTGGAGAGSGGAGNAGIGGKGGTGGVAGVSGGGSGGCAGANLQTDPEHCGDCETACTSEQICDQGDCEPSPCAGICTVREIVLRNGSDEFRKDNLGTTERRCYEVTGYEPAETNARIVCWNATGRSLTVNGDAMACSTGMGQPLQATVGGEYCIVFSAGQSADAGFVLPAR